MPDGKPPDREPARQAACFFMLLSGGLLYGSILGALVEPLIIAGPAAIVTLGCLAWINVIDSKNWSDRHGLSRYK